MYTIFKNKIKNTWLIIGRSGATPGINAVMEKIFCVVNVRYGWTKKNRFFVLIPITICKKTVLVMIFIITTQPKQLNANDLYTRSTTQTTRFVPKSNQRKKKNTNKCYNYIS